MRSLRLVAAALLLLTSCSGSTVVSQAGAPASSTPIASTPIASTPISPATTEPEPNATPEPGQPASEQQAAAPSPESEPDPDATPFPRGTRGQESDSQAEPATDPSVVAQVQDSPRPSNSPDVADDGDNNEGTQRPEDQGPEDSDEDDPRPEPHNEPVGTESGAAQVTVMPTVEAWCAGPAPGIQAALKNILFSRFEDRLALPGVVDELHQLLRDVEGVAPPEIADALAVANASVLELEPVMQPAGWDWDNVDRAVVRPATDDYNSAMSDIDHYNAMACGLQLGMQLPDDSDNDDDDKTAATDVIEPPDNTPPSTLDPLETLELSDEEIELAVRALLNDVPGITEAEARCMVLAILATDTYSDDLGAMLTDLEACGLSLDRLEQLTGD